MILTVGFLKWDGEKWIIDQAFGPQGPQGPIGPIGPQGPAGIGGKTLVGTNISGGPTELVALDSTYVTLSPNTSYTFKVTTIAVGTSPSFHAGQNVALYDMISATVNVNGAVTIISPGAVNLGNIVDGRLGFFTSVTITYSSVDAVGGTPARLSVNATVAGGILDAFNVTSYVELVQRSFIPSGGVS